MHELSIMQGVTEAIRDSAEREHITRVSRIRLVIGRLSMALPESLVFAFDVIKSSDPLFKEAVLEIEERDITCQCQDCQYSFTLGEEAVFICPLCQSCKVDITGGRELYIDFYEGDEV